MLHLDKQKFVGTRAAMSKKITASDAMHGGGEREVELPYETDGDGSRKPTGMVVENFEIAS